MVREIFRVACVLPLLALSTQGSAQQKSPTLSVAGKVTNSDEQPVAGAKVTLVSGWEWEDQKAAATTTSDDDGSFSIELPGALENNLRGVWATSNGRVGWAGPVRVNQTLVIRIDDTQSFEGQLLDFDGKPIAGAKLVPVGHIRSMESGGNVPVAGELRGLWTSKTNAEGRFTIQGVPKEGLLSCHIIAKGFGSPQISFVLTQPLKTKLAAGSPASGQLEWPEGAKRPKDKKELGTVSIHRYEMFAADGTKAKTQATAAYVVLYSNKQPILADGSVKFEALPPGTYSIRSQFNENTPLTPATLKPLVVEKSKPARFTVTGSRAYRIQGRVISSTDGKPVSDASVSASSVQNGRRRPVAYGKTKSDGSYSFHVPKGKLRVRVSGAPGYVGTPNHGGGDLLDKQFPQLQVDGETKWPDIKLHPAVDVVVKVIDSEGKPVPNAEVKTVAASGGPSSFYSARKTDENGECIITGADSSDTLPIWARTDDAVSDRKTVVSPGELDGPVTIEISPDSGVRFRCKVVDRKGKPIPKATVKFQTSFPFVSKWVSGGMSLSGSAGQAHTDEKGIAMSGPLWSGQTYWITASAEGYDNSEAPQLVGTTGVVDIRAFVLKPSRASEIAGIVLDSDGNPLKNVRVFSAGKTWRKPTMHTAADGQFKLKDVAPDIRYVFADAEGYRFGGARVKSGVPVEIRLRPLDSPPKTVRPVRPVNHEERAEAVRKLIDLSLDASKKKPTYRLIQAMAHIDRDRALAMGVLAGGRTTDIARQAIASKLAKDDPAEAIEVLEPSRRAQSNAISIALSLAQSGQANDRTSAKKLANFAKTLISQKEEPAREYAQLVPVLTALSEHAEAERLIRETTKLVESLTDTSGRAGGLIQMTAKALAPYDFKKAEQLCSRLKEGYTRTQALTDAIVATAPGDINKALERLEKLQGDSNTPDIRDKGKARIALMVVDKDPDKAIEIVRSCEEDSNRGQAIGWLCVPLSKKDKQKAWNLIDEALAIHRSERDAYMSWSNFGGAGPPAARLAQQAMQAGYPDMESVVWHVRAACRVWPEQGMARLETVIKTAKVLALVDRLAARELLNAVSHQAPQLGGRTTEWEQAWIMTDFNRAVGMFSDMLEEDQKRGGNVVRNFNLDVLMISDPEEQFRAINSHYLSLWDL